MSLEFVLFSLNFLVDMIKLAFLSLVIFDQELFMLTLPAPILDREKINLNFYFHTSLLCLKRFYLVKLCSLFIWQPLC